MTIKNKKVFIMGKIRISEEDDYVWLTNDDEGMSFSKETFEELLKDLLYKYF